MFDGIVKFLENIAPESATLIGGPFAGVVVSGLEKIFGISNSTPDQLTNALQNVTPDQVIQIQKMNNDLKIQLQQLSNQQDKIQDDSVEEARQVEVQLEKTDPKAVRPLNVMLYMAMLILVAWNVCAMIQPAFDPNLKNKILLMDMILICGAIFFELGINPFKFLNLSSK